MAIEVEYLNADLLGQYYEKTVKSSKNIPEQIELGGVGINIYKKAKSENFTIVVQGKDREKIKKVEKDIKELEETLKKRAENSEKNKSEKNKSESNALESNESEKKDIKPQIFVVYGHNEKLKHEVCRLLEYWQFEPLLIENKNDGANHIIDKLIPLINSSIAGIVLATPDDIGYAKDDAINAKKRWRQNVVLELGMLIAAKGLDNTYIVSQEDKDMERPSDIEGLYRDAVEFKNNKLVNKTKLLSKLFEYHKLDNIGRTK